MVVIVFAAVWVSVASLLLGLLLLLPGQEPVKDSEPWMDPQLLMLLLLSNSDPEQLSSCLLPELLSLLLMADQLLPGSYLALETRLEQLGHPEH